MITVDEFKAHSNITFDDDDALIEAKIEAASAYITGFLDPDVMEGLSGTPASVKEAVRVLVAHWYENREGQDVPEEVFRLIQNYRSFAF